MSSGEGKLKGVWDGSLSSTITFDFKQALELLISNRISPLQSFYDISFHTKWLKEKRDKCLPQFSRSVLSFIVLKKLDCCKLCCWRVPILLSSDKVKQKKRGELYRLDMTRTGRNTFAEHWRPFWMSHMTHQTDNFDRKDYNHCKLRKNCPISFPFGWKKKRNAWNVCCHSIDNCFVEFFSLQGFLLRTLVCHTKQAVWPSIF